MSRSAVNKPDLRRAASRRVVGEDAADSPALQLASLVDQAPTGDDWLHEIKYDGYRVLARVEAGKARLITRGGKDWTHRFPEIASAAARLPAADAVLDGEVAVLRDDGVTSFQALQNHLRHSGGDLAYFIFDLLEQDGEDLRRLALEQRKRRLEDLLSSSPSSLRYSDHVVGNGPAFFTRACDYGLEGIISKRRDAPYSGGRGRDWLKVKCGRRQEFVIVGYTAPGGSRAGFGALLVAAYDESGSLRYAGRVGTGFSDRVLADLKRRLDAISVHAAPVADPPRGAAARGVTWTAPELVAEVAFTEFTEEGLLRHPSFQGLREDKPSADVRIERAVTGAGASRRKTAPARPVRRSGPGGGGDVGRSAGREVVEVAGVALTSPHKVLYAAQGITKLDLARYYERVGEWILPLIAHRPLTLVRCPSGHEECFYQKHLDASAHPAIHRVQVDPGPDAQPYGAVDSVAGLVALVQMGVLELHTWGARRDRLEQPDRITMDLDPDEGLAWSRVVEAALELREFLADLGLESFLKTTGGKGLHLVVPIRRRDGWDEVKEFTRAVAAAVAADAPGRYTLNISKAKRKGRVLIDYLRNGRGATAVEAFSTRARAGAPVAVPVRWSELGPRLSPNRFDIFSLPRRLASLRSDPWEGYHEVRQGITAPMKRAVGLR
jgi:bifunctional non-homologous end joining protein LigD